MKHYRITTALLAALALGTAAGCASGPQQQSAAQYVDDAAITAGVKAAIVGEPSL
jgi:hyperosmotically inducible protein